MANEKSKTVSMENKKDGKLTYEQLEQLAGNLNVQCRQLYSQLQQANQYISDLKEISVLMTVLDKSEHFSEAFVTRCAKKIEDIITNALDSAEKEETKPAE